MLLEGRECSDAFRTLKHQVVLSLFHLTVALGRLLML
jgi:hypothetical protein